MAGGVALSWPSETPSTAPFCQISPPNAVPACLRYCAFLSSSSPVCDSFPFFHLQPSFDSFCSLAGLFVISGLSTLQVFTSLLKPWIHQHMLTGRMLVIGEKMRSAVTFSSLMRLGLRRQWIIMTPGHLLWPISRVPSLVNLPSSKFSLAIHQCLELHFWGLRIA